jgi:hypothetical protein
MIEVRERHEISMIRVGYDCEISTDKSPKRIRRV